MAKNALVKHTERSVALSYALWLPTIFGIHGLHRIYNGRYLSGLIWLITFGFCYVGSFIDLLFIPRMVEDHNEGRDVW